MDSEDPALKEAFPADWDRGVGNKQLKAQGEKILAAVARPVTVTLTAEQLAQLGEIVADLLAAKLDWPLTAQETEDAAYRAAQHAEDS